MRLSIQLLVVAIIAGSAIVSCQSSVQNNYKNTTSNTADCRTIEHKIGTTKVCGQPQRIVVLGPYFLDPLLSLGIQPAAYGEHGVFHQGDYDRPSQQIPYLGDRIEQSIANVGTAFNPSIESIVEVKPDLIIGSSHANAQQYKIFSQIAPTLILDGDATETETNLRTIAFAVDRSQQAERVWKETQQRIAAARETYAPLATKHSKVLLLASSQLQNISLFNSTSHCGSIMEKLGFKIVLPPGYDKVESSSLRTISLEILPQLNEADLIILLGYSESEFDGFNNFDRNQLLKIEQAWQENAMPSARLRQSPNLWMLVKAIESISFPPIYAWDYQGRSARSYIWMS